MSLFETRNDSKGVKNIFTMNSNSIQNFWREFCADNPNIHIDESYEVWRLLITLKRRKNLFI